MKGLNIERSLCLFLCILMVAALMMNSGANQADTPKGADFAPAELTGTEDPTEAAKSMGEAAEVATQTVTTFTIHFVADDAADPNLARLTEPDETADTGVSVMVKNAEESLYPTTKQVILVTFDSSGGVHIAPMTINPKTVLSKSSPLPPSNYGLEVVPGGLTVKNGSFGVTLTGGEWKYTGRVHETASATEPERVADAEAPLVGPVWALLNLILAIAMALASLAMLFGYLGGRKQMEEGAVAREVKPYGVARLLTLLPGIGGILVFILTENMKRTMVFLDRWTLPMAIIAAVQLVLILLGINWDKKTCDETVLNVDATF